MAARLPELDDATLRDATLREPRACRALVERYQRVVSETAARVLGRDAADTHDVAQETFVRAFGALERFDPRGPARLSTWLSTIAVRLALDAARARRRVVSLDALRGGPGQEDFVSRDARPDAALETRDERARLADAMQSLSPEQRAVIVLRIEHELPLDEIARVLGLELGTVKSRLSRARDALAAALLEERESGAKHG